MSSNIVLKEVVLKSPQDLEKLKKSLRELQRVDELEIIKQEIKSHKDPLHDIIILSVDIMKTKPKEKKAFELEIAYQKAMASGAFVALSKALKE